MALHAVSCPSMRFCEAVGQYQNQAFAARYAFRLPRVCCLTFRPKHFGVRAGTIKRGVTLTVTLQRPLTLVLVIKTLPDTFESVWLGRYPKGKARIHWNLHVAGRVLVKGRYQLTLRSVTGGVLSPSAPGSRTLIVGRNGRVHAAP